MYHIDLGKSGLKVPAIAVGCMRISNMDHREASAFVDTALSHGANFFDHADVYGGGKSEEVFGKAIAPLNREDILIQTKCAIHDGLYDFSYAHIVRSVDGSLKRLGTDYIDVLLLHRPDALMEPEEVARAFSYLKESGKVRNFGVSNHNPYQIQLLQKVLDMSLCANQLQFGVMHTSIVDSGINVNMYNEAGINRDGGVLDFCRLENITIQPVLERIRNVADEKQADIGGFCSLRKSPPGQNRVDFQSVKKADNRQKASHLTIVGFPYFKINFPFHQSKYSAPVNFEKACVARLFDLLHNSLPTVPPVRRRARVVCLVGFSDLC